MYGIIFTPWIYTFPYNMKLSYKIIVLGIFIVSFIVGLITLSDYSINWDEPGHYMRGQAYLRYFLTGKEDYKDLPRIKAHYHKNIFDKIPLGIEFNNDEVYRRSLYQFDREGDTFTYKYFVKNDGGHPPLIDILASFSNYIFYQKLGILGDIEGYHVFIIFVSSLLVSYTFLFVATRYSLLAGIIASLSIFLYPLFFSESHFNIKDPAQAAFYTFTILFFYTGVLKNSSLWMIFAGISAGLALGTKYNILFSVFILLFWIVIVKWEKIKNLKWPFSKKITFSIFSIPVIAVSILIISWPNFQENILKSLSFYRTIGSAPQQSSEYYFLGVNTYAIQWIFYATPLAILFFGAVGILYAVVYGRKEKYHSSILFLIWFLLPIARVSFSHAGIYGGARQIMEYIPPFAMLAGVGAFWLHTMLISFMKKYTNYLFLRKKISFILGFLFILSFLPIVFKLIMLHPNENVYFNPLIGGLKGAKEKNISGWGTTLGSSYQQGMNWLNKNAGYNANVALVRGLRSNIPRTKIRDDINFSEFYYSGEKKQGEYLMEVTDYFWTLTIPVDKRKYIETLEPVHELIIEGVPILTIWKNDWANTKPQYRKMRL